MSKFQPDDRVTVTWVFGNAQEQTTQQAQATVVFSAYGTGPFNAEPADGYAVVFDDKPDTRVFVAAGFLTLAEASADEAGES